MAEPDCFPDVVTGRAVPMPRRPVDDEISDVDQGSAAMAVAGIVTLAGGWFCVSRFVLGSPVVDAIGEAAGGVVAVLVLVSVVGALRRSRSRR